MGLGNSFELDFEWLYIFTQETTKVEKGKDWILESEI